jgi:hypothetical protein
MRNKRKKNIIRKDTSAKKKRVYKKKTAVKNPKVPRTRNAGTLTESAFFSKIRSGLRNTFRFWKPMMQALEAVSRPSQDANKRVKKEYQCSHCDGWFQRRMVEIHHIVECGSLKDWDDIVPFLQRLTCEDVNGYEVLCKDCHKKHHSKSKEDDTKP